MNINRDLVTEPIPKLIRNIAMPASIGFFFNTMYNVVDTYYAGFVSTEALAALSLSFPVFFIIIAMGSGISTGATALIAHASGEDDSQSAKYYAIQAISFSVMVAVALSFLGLFLAPWLFGILGASGQYLDLAVSYINIIFYGAIFFLLNFILNGILNSQGDTKTFRNILIVGFVLNLLFDPWFMFGGFGLPAMGLRGVAVATVFIQFISVVYMFWRVSKTGVFCKDCLKMIRPQKKYIFEISKQGFPASLNMMTVALGIFIITYFISKYGSEAVAAYGIATRIDQIALLPAIGVNVAALSLIGQNNGAKQYDRCREVIKKTTKYGAVVGLIGGFLVFILARVLMSVFTKEASIIEHGVTYLHISIFAYVAYTFLFISTSLLQGLKKPFYAIWIGIYRQLLSPPIVFYFLSTALGLGIVGIWWGIFAITWSAAIISFFYLRHMSDKILK
ncbi:MATE family efflux transporter [Patescibacteria group bacterium]|nr:MATE family efflux transporter [Patescibacteria group bacterium]